MTAAVASLSPVPVLRVPVSALRRLMPDVVLAQRPGGLTVHAVDADGRRTWCRRRLAGATIYTAGEVPAASAVCKVCLRHLNVSSAASREELAAMHHARIVRALHAHQAALDGIRSDMIADGSHQELLLISEHFDQVAASIVDYRGRRTRRHHSDPALMVGSRAGAVTLASLLSDSRPKAFRLIPAAAGRVGSW